MGSAGSMEFVVVLRSRVEDPRSSPWTTCVPVLVECLGVSSSEAPLPHRVRAWSVVREKFRKERSAPFRCLAGCCAVPPQQFFVPDRSALASVSVFHLHVSQVPLSRMVVGSRQSDATLASLLLEAAACPRDDRWRLRCVGPWDMRRALMSPWERRPWSCLRRRLSLDPR